MISIITPGVEERAKKLIDNFAVEWAKGRLAEKHYPVKPKRVRPLSHRRAMEFRGRHLRRIFGPARVRAARRAMMVARYGRDWEQQERNARLLAKMSLNSSYGRMIL